MGKLKYEEGFPASRERFGGAGRDRDLCGPPVALPKSRRGVVDFNDGAPGLAWKNRCEMIQSSLTVATTAAAPAVNAKHLADSKQSKALLECTVAPMIFFNLSFVSRLDALIGDLKGDDFEWGEDLGV